MENESTKGLANHSFLLGPDSKSLAAELLSTGARVTCAPRLQISEAGSYSALDEAIENLYGYDWIILINEDAARAFLHRLETNAREVSELDPLRICALGESTAIMLEQAHVHFDIAVAKFSASEVVDEIRSYAGQTDGLTGLNFLIPQAIIGRDYLRTLLEELGARADVVEAYRTVANEDSSLLRLRTLLLSGGFDCVVFASESEVFELARLFDSHDLKRLLANVPIACVEECRSLIEGEFALQVTISATQTVLAGAIKQAFSG